ncbi:MAG TPA: DUF501 domain-containing protein [Gaiellaceae bacterium]|nr:DUF501 domain-containing protein [Gaiellaceae bacterium]
MLPPVVTDADRELVARQLGREPRTLHGVAVRCPFGAPAVTEQSPYAADGEPFPTTYYLTCRHLVAAGRLAGELAPQLPLLLVSGREACGEYRLAADGLAPALDSARRLEP